MSKKSILSLVIALVILAAALTLGGEVSMFINPAGLILVLGGTLAGVVLAFPFQTLVGLWKQIRGLGQRRIMTCDELTRIFVAMARLQRAEGAVALEGLAKKTGNMFLELGASLLADRLRRTEVRERLEQEFEFFASRRESQRAVLGLMGRLAPAFGLAGTMIGLIRMLHTVSDPGAVTEGMSVALLTTFYGIMLANLIILPLERKLGEVTRAEAVEMTLIIEGVMGLASGENGAAIQARMGSFRLAGSGAPAPGFSFRRVVEMAAGIRPARSLKDEH